MQGAIHIHTQVTYFCKYIAILAVFLLHIPDIALQLGAVHDCSSLHREQRPECLCLHNCIAGDINRLQYRILQQMEGHDNAFWHLFKARIEIVEIACRIYRRAVVLHDIHAELVPCTLCQCCFRGSKRRLACTFTDDVNDCLPLYLLKTLMYLLLLRAFGIPFHHSRVGIDAGHTGATL